MSRAAFEARFPDEAACAAYLFARRWPQGFVCPACGGAKGWALTCPLHNLVISLETGLAEDVGEGRVATHTVRVEGGRILIDAALLRARQAA